MQDTVKIALEDKNCGGVTSIDGRRQYNAKNGVVEVPTWDSHGLLDTPLASKYRKGISASRPVMECHRAYDEYLTTHEWMPYMRWYREHWKGEHA